MKKLGIGISPALIRENYKMHWYLPVLIFLGYFFTGIFPLIMNMESLGILPEDSTYSHWSNYAMNSLENENPFFIMGMVGAPLLIALILFGYYHKQEKAFAFSSQPYSRLKVFTTQIVTGLTMMTIPLILIGAIYMAFSGKIFHYVPAETFEDNAAMTVEAVVTLTGVLKWFVEDLIIMMFFFSAFVLAGTLVGTSVMMLLLSGVFFGAIPLVTLLGTETMSIFVDGYYTMSSFTETIMRDSNPIISLIAMGFSFSEFNWLFYLIASVVILLVAGFAVKKGRLENVGDSFIFKSIGEIITWFITFCGAGLCGIASTEIGSELFEANRIDDNGNVVTDLVGKSNGEILIFAICMAIGGIITFSVVKIITNRSIRIFNKENLRSGLAAACIVVIFFFYAVCDVTGISDKVPNVDKIKSVDVYNLSADSSQIAFYGFDKIPEFSEVKMSTDENIIESVVELQKYIVENKTYDSKTIINNNDEGYFDTLYFHYELKNGKTFERQFKVNHDDYTMKLTEDILLGVPRGEWTDKILQVGGKPQIHLILSEAIDEDVYEENMTEEQYNRERLKKYKILNVKDYPELSYGEGIIIDDPEVIEKILRAHDMDAKEINYIQRVGFNGAYNPNDENDAKYNPYNNLYGEVSVYIWPNNVAINFPEDTYKAQNGWMNITPADTRMLECLIELGYINDYLARSFEASHLS